MTSSAAPVRSIATAPSQVSPRVVAGRRRPWLVFTFMILIAFFGLIGSRISLDQSAFTVDRLQAEIATEEARQATLELEIAQLRSPQRIATAAAAMGMSYPSRHVPLAVDLAEDGADADIDRWTELRALLGTQP
ncbi:MAG: hypothetical protein H0V96_06185 [Acidimicrobiia bacterium]|nr:hypothetical protein [Acidimicrobiia bacterium]